MSKKYVVVSLLVALIVGGIGFYGGFAYAQSAEKASAATRSAQFRGMGSAGGFGGRNGQNGGIVSGSIVKKDATSLTVQLRDNSSKVVLISGSTKVGKFVDGTMDDVTNGVNVMITGTTNSDGSVTASMVQIRPADAVPPQGSQSPVTK